MNDPTTTATPDPSPTPPTAGQVEAGSVETLIRVADLFLEAQQLAQPGKELAQHVLTHDSEGVRVAVTYRRDDTILVQAATLDARGRVIAVLRELLIRPIAPPTAH